MGHAQIPASETARKGSIKIEGNAVFQYGYCASATTKKTPYILTYSTDALNPTAIALADGATYNKIGVATETKTSAGWQWFQIQGDCDDMVVPSASYTAGHMLKIHDGAVTSLSATYAGANTEFAVVRTSGTSVTALDVFLMGVVALGTT